MGLRCLLGHEYANREVEREREERGDEVVVTYRTVETCERCGERRIVSENKEVRPVRGPDGDAVTTGLGGGVTPDPGGETTDDPAAPAAGDAGADGDAESVAEPSVADAESGAEVEAEGEAEAGAEAEAEAEAGAEAADADADDAIILDGDDDPGEDRGHGEWHAADVDGDAGPDVEGATADETDGGVRDADDGATVVSDGDWPDPESEDEGYDAEPSDGDPASVSFGGGLTPEGDADGGTAAAANGTTASVAGKQFVAAEEVEPVGDDRHAGETDFFCPNCGHARAADESSMRAGDICPDCHEGYIGERER